MKEFDFAKKIIDLHGLIAFQTDTVIGIGCNGADNVSVHRLFEIKKRPLMKPLYLLTYSLEQVLEFTSSVPDYAFSLIEKFFPGSLTLILPSNKKLYTSPDVTGDTIGVRIPNAPELIEFLAYINLPILNTSANFSGELPLQTVKEVYKTFHESVFFVQFEYNVEMRGSPSTIVDCTGDAAQVIREGSVKI